MWKGVMPAVTTKFTPEGALDHAEMARCFDMVTTQNAKVMNLEGYGLKVGNQASLVVLDAGNPVEALRLRPDRLAVISKGKVIVERTRNDARLNIPGRPPTVRRRHDP